MAIGRDGSRGSHVVVGVASAANYGLARRQAGEIVDYIVSTIEAQWVDSADAVGLSEADRSALWRRSVLNRSTFYD